MQNNFYGRRNLGAFQEIRREDFLCYEHSAKSTFGVFSFVLKVDDWLDARDSDGTWCVAQVVAIEGDSLRVHFQGYSSRYDEDIGLDSSKVCSAAS